MIEQFSEQILTLLQDKTYIPQTLPELKMSLNFTRKEMPKFRKALDRLLNEGKISMIKGDKYAICSEVDLVTGIIRFKPSGRAFMRLEDGGEVEFKPDDTSIAFTGDKVLAKIKSKFSKFKDTVKRSKKKNKKSKERTYIDPNAKKYARVVKILERNTTKVVGTLKRSYNFWFIVADNPNFFYNIIVSDPQKSAVLPIPVENDKVVVLLHDWQHRHINPSGNIIENFGESHTPMSEYKAILSKYDLSESFSPEVEEEVEKIPSKVDKKDIANRCDMRGVFTITIDPEDAKDFDDALSITKETDGTWEVGIHIADVSNYVKPNSPIDKEANKRGNSTYLVGTVIPMLPFPLSNGICSLVEDEDRLVKSVFIKYDDQGKKVGTRFENSVIRSMKRLSYQQAHALMTEDDTDKILSAKSPADFGTAFSGKDLSQLSPENLLLLKTMIRKMWDIASTLRNDRINNGSLDFNMPEFKIFCDEQGYADRIEKIEYDESHQLVEEFMLAANEAVAYEMFTNHIPYISRVHDKPDEDKLNELRDELAGFDIKCGNLTSRKEVIKVLEQIAVHEQAYLLKIKFLRSLKRAEYREVADGHYGLNKVYYAHFTSPIRRYADLTVHRNLNHLMMVKGVKSAPKTATLTSKVALASIATLISSTEQKSTEAERDSKKIKLMEFYERAIGTGESFEAVVTAVSNNGLFIELTQSMAFGFVNVNTMLDDFYRLNENNMTLYGKSTGKVIGLGDIIYVESRSVDRFKRQIDFNMSSKNEASKPKTSVKAKVDKPKIERKSKTESKSLQRKSRSQSKSTRRKNTKVSSKSRTTARADRRTKNSEVVEVKVKSKTKTTAKPKATRKSKGGTAKKKSNAKHKTGLL